MHLLRWDFFLLFFFQKEASLCTLMKFVELEARYPLIKVEWKGTLTFPRELLKVRSRTEKFLLSLPGGTHDLNVLTFSRTEMSSQEVFSGKGGWCPREHRHLELLSLVRWYLQMWEQLPCTGSSWVHEYL